MGDWGLGTDAVLAPRRRASGVVQAVAQAVADGRLASKTFRLMRWESS
jgi:hypothetical protein